MPDATTTDKEKHMKQLKRRMECWREVIVPLNSVILWDQSWHPGLIVGFTSSVFLLVWFLEPALLTLLSIFLLVLALVDYLVPILTATFFSSTSWTGQKERKLDEICQSLSSAMLQIQAIWRKVLRARNNRPNIYYGSVTIILLILAWVGNTVNNLFLIYVIVNSILLLPGLKHKGRAQQAVKFAYSYMLHRKQS